jgi:hypothetical protein
MSRPVPRALLGPLLREALLARLADSPSTEFPATLEPEAGAVSAALGEGEGDVPWETLVAAAAPRGLKEEHLRRGREALARRVWTQVGIALGLLVLAALAVAWLVAR